MRNPGTIPRLFVSSPRETILDYPIVQHRLSEMTMRNPGTIPRLFVSSPRETILDYPIVQHRLSQMTMRNPGTISRPSVSSPRETILGLCPASSLGEDDAKIRYGSLKSAITNQQ